VRTDQSRYDALDAMLRARHDSAVVLDTQGHPVGTLTWSAIMREPPVREPPPRPGQAPPASAPARHAGGQR
jgi:osmoprotectant transport system ATP-binding protein